MGLATIVGKEFEAQGVTLNYLPAAEDAETSGFIMPVSLQDLGITLRIFVSFEEDNMSLNCHGVGRVPSDRQEKVHAFLNEINGFYRWAKIFANSDGLIVLRMDQYVSEATAADAARYSLAMLFRVVGDLYPKLMKELWS